MPITPEQLQDMRERAERWLPMLYSSGQRITRENAINEDHMALDVIDLINEVGELRMAIDDVLGPHCSSCGNPIDPNSCHCGDSIDHHRSEDHVPVPVGCVCGYANTDWKALAKSRGEFMWQQRDELMRVRAALTFLRSKTTGHQLALETVDGILDGTIDIGALDNPT